MIEEKQFFAWMRNTIIIKMLFLVALIFNFNILAVILLPILVGVYVYTGKKMKDYHRSQEELLEKHREERKQELIKKLKGL